MKAFFERYSYDSVRMLLNQFAISIFGFALALTSLKAENNTLLLVTGICSIIFYLALNYGVAWRAGSKDKITIDRGRRTFRPATGLWISLLANSLNFLLAIIVMIGALAGLEGMAGIGRFIGLFIQGMYQGVLVCIQIGGESVNNFWWVFFLIPLPALLISFLGYIAGVKDFHITKLGIPDLPESDRPTKAERREQKKNEQGKQD